MARKTKRPRARDNKTRQSEFRERQITAGLKRITVYLPAKTMTRVDAQARSRGVSRDDVLGELVGQAVAPAATPGRLTSTVSASQASGVSELADALVASLEAVERAVRTTSNKTVHDSAKAAHQQAKSAYRALPQSLRSSAAGRRVSQQLGRLSTWLKP